MIIFSLEAESLQCYRRLRLADLLRLGLIGVSGDNEMGKGAIGELLCFALFGRSDALALAQTAALVRWGTSRGSLVLVLAAHGQDYEIRRQIEADGEQSARLGLPSASEPLARGSDAVAKRLSQLLGLGFQQYLESGHLAQSELKGPQPKSPALRQIAGVAPLLVCAEELRADVEVEQEAAQRLEDRVAAIGAELAALAATCPAADGVDPAPAATCGRERAVAGLLKGLPEAAQAYTDAARPSLGEGLRRSLGGLASVLLLLATLMAAGLWGLLRVRPELWPMPAARRWLEALVAPLGLTVEAALVYGGIALAGGFLLVGLWHLVRALGTSRRRARGRRLAAEREQASRKLAGQRGQIGTLALASELLEASARLGWERFAECVGVRVGRILARLTDRAYEHLELDEVLGARLYSADKRGFLEAAEISSGTQRQVLLALHPALVGELAARLGRDRQLAFLDEPFAFFDETRMRGGLASLREDESIAQVWLVAQRFPKGAGLSLEIRCARQPGILEVTAGAPGPRAIGAAAG